VLASDSNREAANVFALFRGKNQGPMNSIAAQQLELLIPHAKIALAIETQISEAHSFSLFSETAMESMSIAALQVASDGRIKCANRLAAGILQDGDGLRQSKGILSAVDSERNQRLHALIANATGDADEESISPPEGALQVIRTKASTAFQISVVPSPKEHRLHRCERSALVFISDPLLPPRSRSCVMQQLYDLTPTEARIVDTLLQGLEIREVAGRLSITYETARFHLKRILAKTGTPRQAELIRLVLSLPGKSEVEITSSGAAN
jgi:DNA-binding CsgD family transcriptional regulator